MDNKKRTRMLMIVAVLTLLILVTGATYAYFVAQGGQGSNVNMNVTTHTTDSLVFEVGAPISIYADQSNFADGMANQFGKTTATATAKAGSNTEKFTGKYNIFFVIDENDFEYTTGNSTAELIMTVKDPNGTELTTIPNLTHTTVKGVTGFDITTKKGTYAIAKEYVIEAATGATKIDNWEITVTLVNLDSNQNANTKKTFRGQLFVTKEDMESYALPVVNTIETTVGGSGTELQVKAKTGASTAEVKKYYYKIDEITSTSQLKVKALKVTPLAIGTYEESDSDTHTFTGLTAGKDYKVSIYTKDANGFKSSVYTETVSTGSYVLPKITSVDASTGATNFSLTVNTTAGDNAISKYFYKLEGVDTKYQESTSNKKDYSGLTTGETYRVSIYAQDANGRNSYVYSVTVTPEKPINPVAAICNGQNIAKCLSDNASIDDSLYHHNGTILATVANSYANIAVGDVVDANDNSYRYAGENPNNWVCFGHDDETRIYTNGWCDDEHLYRIIGIFNEKNTLTGTLEQRVKLIKAYEGTEATLGKKTHGTSVPDSTYYKGKLENLSEYYWHGTVYNGSNIWTESSLNIDTLNGTYLALLGEEWSEKIATTQWKIGGNTHLKIYYNVTPAVSYQNEVVNPTPGSDGNNIKTTNKKIGLMYVSDYGFATIPKNWSTYFYSSYTSAKSYASDLNRKNNWLFLGISEWTITRFANSFNNSPDAFLISKTGSASYNTVSKKPYVIRPTFYLNSNITFAGGSGTEIDPYRIA